VARHHSIFHFWNTVCSCRLPATAARWPTKQPTTQHNPTTQRRNDAQARNGGVSLLARGRRWPHHTEWTPRLAAVIRDCVVRVLVLVPNLLMVVCWWLGYEDQITCGRAATKWSECVRCRSAWLRLFCQVHTRQWEVTGTEHIFCAWTRCAV